MKHMKKLIVFGCTILMACSSASKRTEHVLHKILLYNLHLRRPLTAGAQPTGEVGQARYESHPKPNEYLDCEPIRWLFKDLNLAALRSCFLNSSKLQTDGLVSYIL